MKSILLALILGFQVFSPSAFDTPVKNEIHSSNLENIDNGWYNATVAYFNPITYQKSTYTLSVKVEYDSVTAIDFGNGGSVHSGYNNSGYTYSGGRLSMKTDYQGNIVAATTRVSVWDSNGTRTYDITIE